jgi:hypothetical protein
MPEPFIRLDRLRDVKIDSAAEVRKIIASECLDHVPEGSLPLTQIYHTYKNLKKLGFFRLVIERFGNTECRAEINLRVYDIYEVSTGRGHIFFMVEASRETIDAFLDDGSILLKIRDWLADSYRRVCMAGDAGDVMKIWDDAFHAPGSPLPAGVMVVPFYHKELAPGVPGVILVLVKEVTTDTMGTKNRMT